MKQIVFLLAAFLASMALAEPKFQPLAWPAAPEDNFEDRAGMWLRPTLGAVDQVLPLKTRCWATAESVTGGVALKWVFEPGSTGQFCIEKSAKQYPPESAGITFYAKASRPLTLGVGGRDLTATVDVTTEWQKFDLPWSKLGQFDWQTFFGVKGPIGEKTWLIIDRLGTEGPQFARNPTIEPKDGPDQTIASKDILYGAANLAQTAERLKARKPVKLFAIGDSVTAGAQLNRGSFTIPVEQAQSFLYVNHLARLLQAEFGYKEIVSVAKGIGGQIALQGLARMDKDVLAEATADDLIIIEFGANDMGWHGDTPAQWKANIRKLIDKAKTRTSQIVVMSPTVGDNIPKQAQEITRRLKELVQEEKVAAADITLFSMYRGEPFAWALLANHYHPDIMGHVTIAEMMAPLLTGKERVYPE